MTKDVHQAARKARAKQGGEARLKLIWLVAAAGLLALSLAIDALVAQPAFWTGAQPFVRAAIGAGGALIVLISAQIARFLLTRSTPAATPSQEEGR